MSDEAAEIIERALRLPVSDRRKVLIRLQDSLDPLTEIAAKRDAEMDAGFVEPVPDELVQERARQRIEEYRRPAPW